MPDHPPSSRYHAPLVLPDNRGRTLKVLTVDFLMFSQLVLFVGVCATVGLACYLLDRLTSGNRFLNGFTRFFDGVSRLGHKS